MDICVDVRWQLIPAEAEEVSVVNISAERHDGTPIQQQIDGCLWVLKAIILCRDPRGSAVGDPAHALHQTQPEHAQKPHRVSKGGEGSMTWLARTIFDTLPLAGCFSCVDSGKNIHTYSYLWPHELWSCNYSAFSFPHFHWPTSICALHSLMLQKRTGICAAQFNIV